MCFFQSAAAGRTERSSSTLQPLRQVECTIKVLDVFDVAQGKLNVEVRGEVVGWIHDGSRVGGVVQAKGMAKFMDCYSKQVESWKTVHDFYIRQRKT